MKEIGRQVKCQFCNFKDDSAALLKEHPKGYIHRECIPAYLKHREFVDSENQQWDKIFTYLKETHGALVLPKGIITRLQKLRNGTYIKAGKLVKQFKCGFDYELIMDAYLLGNDSIKWNLANKLSVPHSESAMHYCFEIMYGKLSEAWQRRENKRKQIEKEIRQELQPVINDMSIEYKNKNNNKKDESDITAFL